MHKYVYLFSEGNAKMRELLGGKGANLAEMSNIGMPVPQGFTITTEACTQYYEDGKKINDEIMSQIMEYVAKMEEINGKRFGDLTNPLLVSVRSGARASMPGMMDTILNLGLNDEVVKSMIENNPDPKFERFVYDSYRRFIQMFSDVVMEVGKKYFEQLIDKMKAEKGVKFDTELTAADLRELAEQFKAEYKKQIGEDFPSDPKTQLYEAIRAVFRSWDNPRANVYRRDNDIPYSWGTAVNVMPMVFGNLNENSGTGVAFTRDPATGERKLMGEFLTNAQGEDVVAGVRTPMPIKHMEELFPEAYAQFLDVCNKLEDHYRDMQDMEFTVENGKLYMLQCRSGKRTAQAALKIACDLVDEGMISEQQAVAMIDPRNLDTLLHPQFDAKELKNVRGAIDVDGVSFAYGSDEVLDNVSLHVKPGETVAIVGPSGGGKSTLCKLIPRFYDVSEGAIRIDGQDVRAVTQESLHRAVGVVQQEVFLFADTIGNNIRYGKPDATQAEIEAAAKKAEIYDDIMAMPDGFDTNVGERGSMLSGGQKQRVSIARIFLKNPPVLILDEATSALDSVTESRIQSALDALAEGRTTLIIAHRLSTIRSAGRIIAVADGKIVEEGTHDELLARNGLYAKLYRTQNLGENT